MNVIQCRMARCALNWTTRQLAQAADIPVSTIQSFLVGTDIAAAAVHRMRRAFEQCGLVFLDEDPNGGGFGVRLRNHGLACAFPRPNNAGASEIERMEVEIVADR